MLHKDRRINCGLVDGVVNNKLIFRTNLYIIPGLELPVLHMIILHTHEGSIRISFGIRRSTIQFAFLFFILAKLWQMFPFPVYPAFS
ncbi:MAG: hypothetical protein R2824_07000 [Saprospiraceae bacterium]